MLLVRYLVYVCMMVYWLPVSASAMAQEVAILERVLHESRCMGYDVYVSVQLEFETEQVIVPCDFAPVVADEIMNIQQKYQKPYTKMRIHFYLADILQKKNAFKSNTTEEDMSYLAQQCIDGIAMRYRSFTACNNPYIVFAALLKCCLQGIRHGLHRDDIRKKNNSIRFDDNCIVIVWEPDRSDDALLHMLESDFMRDWLGYEFLQRSVVDMQA